MVLSSQLLALLCKVDTPTVCKAIETTQGKRGFAPFTRGTMISLAPMQPPVVVPALAIAIARLQQTERIILDAVRPPDFVVTLFEQAWADFKRART